MKQGKKLQLFSQKLAMIKHGHGPNIQAKKIKIKNILWNTPFKLWRRFERRFEQWKFYNLFKKS